MQALQVNTTAGAAKRGFRPSSRHSSYISDAFTTNSNPKHAYNMYTAQELGESSYELGEILFKGRRDGKGIGTSKWGFEDFKKGGSKYASHTDVIVEKGKDGKGSYVIVAGGNISDTYSNKKYYIADLAKRYKGKLSLARK